MAVTYLLTCEHAGNEIPPEFSFLFSGKEEELYLHKAIDFGALQAAKALSGSLKWPLYFSTISRLLVEANRSLDNEELFSDFTKKLAEVQKAQILERYYFPHRNEVESLIGLAIASGKKVVHFAIHTFTPVLEGDVRKADIGILFDPKQPLEKAYASQLKNALQKVNPERKVIYNSPYPGTDDGFPTYLRKIFDKEVYAGFEIEINQKFFLVGEPETWQELLIEIKKAFKMLQKA